MTRRQFGVGGDVSSKVSGNDKLECLDSGQSEEIVTSD